MASSLTLSAFSFCSSVFSRLHSAACDSDSYVSSVSQSLTASSRAFISPLLLLAVASLFGVLVMQALQLGLQPLATVLGNHGIL